MCKISEIAMRNLALGLAAAAALLVGPRLVAGGQQPTPAVTLADLTVPADRLPTGCALKAAPWIGTNTRTMGAIRQFVDGYNVRMPDGPPFTLDQASATQSSMQLRFAEGVESAYAATYTATSAYEPSRDFAVRAVQFKPGVKSERRFSATSDALVIER